MLNKKKLAIGENVSGYLFILPLIIYFCVFLFLPMIISLVYSFTTWNMRTPAKFVGLQNYKDLFFNSLLYPKFWLSLGITLKYILFELPGSIIIALFLAMLLNMKIKGRNLFRTLFYIPVVTGGVAVTAMWKWILDPGFGLLNVIIKKLPGGLINTHSWLNEPETALPALAVMAIWGGLGFKILIFLSGLKTIPNELYEASYMDGANAFHRFFNITLPMLAPTTFFLVVTGFIGSFQAFDSMYLLTGGGPNDSTTTYVLSLYNHAFNYSEMGVASAMSYILFLIILIVTAINFKFVPQSVD